MSSKRRKPVIVVLIATVLFAGWRRPVCRPNRTDGTVDCPSCSNKTQCSGNKAPCLRLFSKQPPWCNPPRSRTTWLRKVPRRV